MLSTSRKLNLISSFIAMGNFDTRHKLVRLSHFGVSVNFDYLIAWWSRKATILRPFHVREHYHYEVQWRSLIVCCQDVKTVYIIFIPLEIKFVYTYRFHTWSKNGVPSSVNAGNIIMNNKICGFITLSKFNHELYLCIETANLILLTSINQLMHYLFSIKRARNSTFGSRSNAPYTFDVRFLIYIWRVDCTEKKLPRLHLGYLYYKWIRQILLHLHASLNTIQPLLYLSENSF